MTVPIAQTAPRNTRRWHRRLLMVAAATALVVVASIVAWSQFFVQHDPRAYKGSLPRVSFQHTLSVYRLRLPSCPVYDLRYLDDDNFSARVLYLKFSTYEECLKQFLGQFKLDPGQPLHLAGMPIPTRGLGWPSDKTKPYDLYGALTGPSDDPHAPSIQIAVNRNTDPLTVYLVANAP